MIQLFLLLFTSLSFSSELFVKPKAYFDSEKGVMVYDKIIKIKDQSIESILNSAGKAPVLDLSDTYLLPGFFDCHTHILFTQEIEDQSFTNALKRELKTAEDFRLKRAETIMKDYLHAGFTSLCDLGNSGKFLDKKLRDKHANDSEFPELFVSGPGIAVLKGQFSPETIKKDVESEYTIIDDSTDISKLLNFYLSQNVDILKIYLDNDPGAGAIDGKLLEKILKNPGLKKFKKVTYHSTTNESYKMALRMKLNSVEHAYTVPAPAMNWVTTTDLDRETLKEFQLYREPFYFNQLKRLKMLFNNSSKIVFGSDLYFNHPDRIFSRGEHVKKSFRFYREAGVDTASLLKILTINPARSLGMEKRLGNIKPGAMANLIGFKKNPLENFEVLMDKPLVINKGKILNSAK